MSENMATISEFMGLSVKECKLPEATELLNKKPGAAYHATLASMLNWVLSGQIKAYPNNRGTGKVSNSTFNRIFNDGVCPDVIGECTFGIYQSQDGDKHLCFNNFHSRAKAFIARYLAGKMTSSELKTQIAFRVQTEFIESYQKLNAPGSAHKTKDKISNPDLAYGSILHEVFAEIGTDAVNMIGNNKWTILSAIMYNLCKNKVGDWYWPKVYRLRGDAREIADEKAGSLKISKAKVDELVDAIKFWHEFMLQIMAQNANKMKVDKIIKSAGFFGYVLADCLSSKSFNQSTKINSNRVFSHYDKLLGALPELTRGNDQAMTKFTGDLDKIFKKALPYQDAA